MAIESFEVTKGKKSGDMLSAEKEKTTLKIGLLAAAFFEYFRMYDNIEREVTADMQAIAAA